MPTGHAARLAEPLRWRARELWTAAVATLLVAATLALGTYAYLHGRRAGETCVAVTAATSTGGATLRACGARARSWCSSSTPLRAAGGTRPIAANLRGECRRAGLR